MTAFWTEKRVVVTGGAGFLGSFVVEQLRAKAKETIEEMVRVNPGRVDLVEKLEKLYLDQTARERAARTRRATA